MRSSLIFAAVVLSLLVSSCDSHAQQPQTPPVETPPVIAPPVVVKPDADEPLTPTPDPLTKPFAIVATSRGAVLGDLIARPEVGHLLKLTLEGLPESADPVFWTYSEVIPDRDERDGGKWVGLSFPPESAGKAYLIQAAVNGEAGKPPLVAMRWLVVSGKGPQPPPVVVVPPGPKPDVPPVVEAGKRAIVIVSESAKDKPWFSRMLTNLREGHSAKYLTDNGHTLTWLDSDQITDGDGWKQQLTGLTLPAAFYIDPATNTVVFKESLKADTTADNIIETIKRNGG